MNKDHIRIMGDWFVWAVCFPKKYYPTIEEAKKKYHELFKDGMYQVEKIEEHQVGLFRYWVKTSYEYNEWDEKIDYKFVEDYNPKKKYSERFAPTCWCFMLDLSRDYTDYINKTLHTDEHMSFKEFLKEKDKGENNG